MDEGIVDWLILPFGLLLHLINQIGYLDEIFHRLLKVYKAAPLRASTSYWYPERKNISIFSKARFSPYSVYNASASLYHEITHNLVMLKWTFATVCTRID